MSPPLRGFLHALDVNDPASYDLLMPTVYRTDTNPSRYRFHRTKDCRQLTKRSKSKRKAEVQAVPLEELTKGIPCLTCYTEAPDPRISHRRCTKCNKKVIRPCAHNGGIPVFITHVHRKQTLFSEPGEVYTRLDYVWPERLHLHI